MGVRGWGKLIPKKRKHRTQKVAPSAKFSTAMQEMNTALHCGDPYYNSAFAFRHPFHFFQKGISERDNLM